MIFVAYDVNYPLDTEYVSNVPKAIRDKLEQLRADTDPIVAGAIVNAKKLQGYLPANTSGSIPISNGTINIGLNSEMLGGHTYDWFTPATHIGAKGTAVHAVADATNAGFMPTTHFSKVADIIANPNNYYNALGFGGVVVTGSNTVSSTTFSDTLTITPSSLMSITSSGKIITIDLAKDGSNNALHNHVIASGSNSGFINATMYNNYQTAFAHVSDTSKHYNFGNVAVGATTIVADTTQDTLTFTAGTGITLTGDAGTDTVTIAVTQDGHNHALATTGSNGFMSSTHVTNLNSAITHYGLNHNNFGNILVGSTTVASDAMNDTVEFVAGTGIAITPNATNDTITFAVSNVDATKLSGYSAGNATGNIPLSNGTLNVNLNADKLDSLTSTQFLRSDTANTGVTGNIYFDNTAERKIGVNGGNYLFFLPDRAGMYDAVNSRNILNYTTASNTVTSVPAWTFSVAPTAPTYISNVATGTAPFSVSSTTKVTNLNVDKVDGYDSTSLVLVDGSQAMSGALKNSSAFVSNTPTNTGAKFVIRNAGSNYLHMYASANETFAIGLSAYDTTLPASPPLMTVDANGIASAGSVKVAGKFEIKYNATSDSLDFNYVA
jgi:hypothetical protein